MSTKWTCARPLSAARNQSNASPACGPRRNCPDLNSFSDRQNPDRSARMSSTASSTRRSTLACVNTGVGASSKLVPPLLDAGQQVLLVSLGDERPGTPDVLASRHHGRQFQFTNGYVLDPPAEPAHGHRLRGQTHEGRADHLAPVSERLSGGHRRGGQLRVGPPVQRRRHTCSITGPPRRCPDGPNPLNGHKRACEPRRSTRSAFPTGDAPTRGQSYRPYIYASPRPA